MTDMVLSAWFESDPEIAYGQAYEAPLANNQLEFASGFHIPEGARELRAAGGVYVAQLQITFGGWNQVPTEGFVSAGLKHIADETQNEVLLVHGEINSLHAAEGHGDAGFVPAAHFDKLGMGVVEGPGKFVLQIGHAVDTEDLYQVYGRLVIAKF